MQFEELSCIITRLFTLNPEERVVYTQIFTRRLCYGTMLPLAMLINNTNRGCRLIHHAFHHILSRKARSYRSLLAYLDFEIGRSKYRYHRKFKSLVREGQVTFAQFVSCTARDIFRPT